MTPQAWFIAGVLTGVFVVAPVWIALTLPLAVALGRRLAAASVDVEAHHETQT